MKDPPEQAYVRLQYSAHAGKGVYPQIDGSLATADIDASREFVDLWVHLSFAIFAIFDVKRQLKWISTKI